MRLWAIVWIVMPAMLVSVCTGSVEAADVELRTRVELIISDLGDPRPAVREQADGKLRNLPLSAYPMVTRLYEKDKETLDAEARSRIESSIAMFKALAAIDERERKYWGWIGANSLKAYDQSSNRNSRWDEPARQAIALATTWDRSEVQTDQLRTCFARANEAKCEDPLFIYYYAVFYGSEGGADDRKQLELLVEALQSASRRFPYPAWVKCMISCKTQAALLRRPDIHIGEIFGLLPGELSSFGLFQQIRPEDDVPEQLLYEMADSISRQSGNDLAKYWFDRLAKPFARLAADPVYLQVLKGSCYARDAMRRDDVAPLPPNRAAKSQEERFASAVTELEKAYSMDRTLPMVPREMLLILLWHGAEQEQINQWYARALEINPDDYQVCRLILENLPLREKLAFGRKCLEGQNWRGRLPLILVGAHEANGDRADDKNEYWRRANVWKEVRSLYETYLEYFPREVKERSRYALLANRCGQWAEADRQFKILGDKPSLKVFGSMASYDYQRKKAAKNLAATAPSAK